MLRISLRDDIFGNEAGEDENPEILEQYFVTTNKFDKFFDFERKISVVNAKKGVGKSALLMTFFRKLENSEQKFIIKETGNSLLGLITFDSSDPVYLENYWKQVICQRINIEIGNRINFALNDTTISLVELSELNGLKSKNLLSALLDRLEIKLPGFIEKKSNGSEKDPVSLLKNFQEQYQDEKIWILIDDIDAKYLDDEVNQARIGAFFSAIRSLSNDMKGLYIRSTIRSDVWTNLRYLEDLDKWEQYIIEINWTQKQIRDILSKQILAYVQRKYPESKEAKLKHDIDYNKIFGLLFETPIQWQGTSQSIFSAIHAFSNKRPRWLNQVCRMALEKTVEANPKAQKIKLENFTQIMQKFGRNRKADLLKEHKHQFKQLDKFIDSFRGHKREYSYNELILAIELYFIRERSSVEIGMLDGFEYQKSHDLGAFAYKIGIISNKDGSRFTHYSEDPDLFNTQRNINNELTWSIHISYWEYLGLKN